MEEKKLTAEEIIKDFSELIGYETGGFDMIPTALNKKILDLIHRLKKENEELKSPKFASWKLKFFNLKEEFDKELSEHEEFTKKAKAEIERLTEENEYLDMVAKQALADYQNTQVQVDELTDKLGKVLSGIKADELLTAKGIEQAVKDTEKEILQEVENLLHECAIEYANAGHKDYFGVCENISWKVIRKIAKEKGVEVE